MATKAELFKSEQERLKAPKAKKVVKPSRKARTEVSAKTAKNVATKKRVKGSDLASKMKSITPESRHARRSG